MSLGMGFENKNSLATSSFSLSFVFEGKDVRSQHPVAMAVPGLCDGLSLWSHQPEETLVVVLVTVFYHRNRKLTSNAGKGACCQN